MKLWYDRKSKDPSYFIQLGVRNGKKTTTKNVARIGKHSELLKITDDPLAYAKEQVKKYNEEYKKQNKVSLDIKVDFAEKIKAADTITSKSTQLNIGYFFLQQIYHELDIHSFFKKATSDMKIEFDPNLVNRFMTYSRILNPDSKLGSYQNLSHYYEQPDFDYVHILRTMDIMKEHYEEYISHLYEKSCNIIKRDTSVCFYDCTNYYFEAEQEDGSKKYGKSKEHRPNPIVQMGLFMDGDGIPLAFSIFPGNSNEQTSLKPLEEKVISKFGCQKFIYCSDAGLGSEKIRNYNHLGERAFIVTQSIKKLPCEDKEWALDKTGFKKVSDDKPVDITKLSEDDTGLYYKDEPYTPKKLHQRLIITYSPKYAKYQKTIRGRQIERAQKMLDTGDVKKCRKNPNDPARFIGKFAVTDEGEVADIHNYLDTDKIKSESQYDGLYAVCTDLLDDDVSDILKVSEGRWEIEKCFRIMKTDFEARPVYLQNENRIKAHFLTCFLSLILYRYLEHKLGGDYTCEEILNTLKKINFASIQEQGFIPVYERTKLTDRLHELCNFRTDYQFITKSQMKTIQKKSKGRE